MKWSEQRVTTLGQFIEEIEDISPNTMTDAGHYWFRGQSSAQWGLEPSLLRSSRVRELSPRQAEGLETEALQAFRSKAHLFVAPHLLDKVKTTPCWWALMQHYGAPTRLLDWTMSPYVAAYFAAKNDSSQNDGVVWCFCRDTLRSRCESQCGTPPDFEAPEAHSWYEDALRRFAGQSIVMPLAFHLATSDRMAAQQGRFTMCFEILRKHNCMIEQIGTEYIRKIIIPHECKPDFLLRLREMNIAASSLFPGVDGLGWSVQELVSLGAHYKLLSKSQE